MADESDHIGQQEIEELLEQARGAAGQSPGESPAAEQAEYGAVKQDEIDSLLSKAEAAAAPTGAAQTAVAPPAPPPVAPSPPKPNQAGDDVQFLLDQAQQAIASVDQPVSGGQGLAPFQLQDFTGSTPNDEKATFDLMRDVELDVQIELGRTNMYLDEVLRLRRGAVVALDKIGRASCRERV